MSVYIVDTRNQKDDFVVKALEKRGHKVLRSKLPFGDVALSTNLLNAIDLKSSSGGLIEVAKNICSKDHNRLKREILNCLEFDGNLTFMCFEPGISSIEDVVNWQVPRFKSNLYKVDKETKTSTLLHKKGDLMTKVKPETLMKAIKTMCEKDHYKQGTKIDFVFATKENCGEKIEQILGEIK